ncbi:hypothetical protein, partial [Bacteroides heparinolyticus]|uniref:hypothetical protein n=1 Tax=Prevotella heparinolytica TaxID=28113 RepID=UPI0035A09CC4
KKYYLYKSHAPLKTSPQEGRNGIGKSRVMTLGSRGQRHWEVVGDDIGKSQATTLGSHEQRH